MPRLRPLTGLDAAFLYLEASGTPMHVGSLMLLDAPKRRGYDFHAALVRVLGERLPAAPALRRVLVEAPLGLAHPMWRETDVVDLSWHVRRQKVPRAADAAQLNALVAKLHEDMLPRDRPLWQLVVLQGLPGGRIALYSKVHHALLDGQGAVALARTLLDLEPDPRPPEAGAHAHAGSRRAPGRRDVARTAWNATLRQFSGMVRALPATIKLAGRSGGAGALLERLRDSVRLAPRTPFNVQLDSSRSYAVASLPLAQVKQVAKSLGVSLNDVVLAICSTALRGYLGRRRALPKEPLVAAMPVSLRGKGDGESNNQVSMAQCTLATDEADPLVRLRTIAAATQAIKAGVGAIRDLIPTDFPGLAAPIWATGLSRLWGSGHLSERLPPLANVVVSNVPGPPIELYLAGARLRHCYPVSIVIHGLAFNITVQSYGEHLEFGLIACRKALPNPVTIARALQPALDRLSKIATDETS